MARNTYNTPGYKLWLFFVCFVLFFKFVVNTHLRLCRTSMRPQQDRLVDEFLFILLIVVDVHSLTTFQSRLNSNNAGGGGGGGSNNRTVAHIGDKRLSRISTATNQNGLISIFYLSLFTFYNFCRFLLSPSGVGFVVVVLSNGSLWSVEHIGKCIAKTWHVK